MEHISPIQQIDNYQSHQIEHSVVPNEQQTVRFKVILIEEIILI